MKDSLYIKDLGNVLSLVYCEVTLSTKLYAFSLCIWFVFMLLNSTLFSSCLHVTSLSFLTILFSVFKFQMVLYLCSTYLKTWVFFFFLNDKNKQNWLKKEEKNLIGYKLYKRS